MKLKMLIACVLIFLVYNVASSLDYNVSFPHEVEVGKWFNVNVSLKSETPLNVTLYSYVYKGFNCVGQGWTDNKQTIILHPNLTEHVVLKDFIKHGTEDGYYNIRLKIKYSNETIVKTETIRVVSRNDVDPTYLYIGLVVVSLVGLYAVMRK